MNKKHFLFGILAIVFLFVLFSILEPELYQLIHITIITDQNLG